jgi:hypothetical protein
MGRFWGVSSGIKKNRDKPRIIELSEDELREVLRENGKEKIAEWDVLPKYIWNIGQITL